MVSSVSPNLECLKLRTLYSLPPLRHERNKNTMSRGMINVFSLSSSRNMKSQRVNHVCCSFPFDDFHKDGKREILEPSLLGIQPEPPSWPEREEILRLSFERRVKSVGIPLSIRMIKKKLQLEQGFKYAASSESIHCCVKKCFSSLLFILHELQNHALKTRESLCGDDLESVIVKLNREMDDSFVWLFRHVFSETPTLMVDVMVLLSNFSMFSMMRNNNNNKIIKDVLHGDLVVQDERVKELTEEEELLWNSMLEEVSKMEKELRGEVFLDHETKMNFVAPICVEIEGDQYEEYEKTKDYYKKHISLTPNNSLLLSNYAQFLFLVLHDNDE